MKNFFIITFFFTFSFFLVQSNYVFASLKGSDSVQQNNNTSNTPPSNSTQGNQSTQQNDNNPKNTSPKTPTREYMDSLDYPEFSIPSYSDTASKEVLCDDSLLGCNEVSTNTGYEEHYVFRYMIKNIISAAMQISIAFSVLMGIIAGIIFLFSRGSDEMVTKGRNIFTFMVIGLIVSSFSFLIVEIINRLPV